MLKTREVEYQEGDDTLRGFLATGSDDKKPCVLIAHPWAGRGDFVLGKAKYLAELGYAGFAIDMYGNAVTGADRDECAALMNPFLANRELLKRRMLAALECVRSLPEVDSANIAAMGFCFGGMCVLDLARSGADIKGVISFHGLLGGPRETDERFNQYAPAKIQAKVLVLHGYDDPMASPDNVLAFAEEMTAAGADWQIHVYGNTVHAFTNPEADDKALGTVYNKDADLRSHQALENFLAEIF